MSPTPAQRPRIILGAGRLANRLHLPTILRNQTAGGAVMLAATIAALLWANLAPSSYERISGLEVGPLSVAHWAADGILTIFFFVAGMELKREFVEGSLSRPADALVPIIAAAAGMIVPAGIYLLVNGLSSTGDTGGWAIPMATDIAFALAVLALVGRGLPMGVRAFLLTLAIVDDLGAILVIAVFFADGVNLLWLLGVAVLVAAWWLLQRFSVVRSGWWLLPIAVAAWWCMLQSGVHATIAGVVLGLLVRTDEHQLDDNLDRWSHRVEPWSAWVAVPIFAVFAAGVPVSLASLGNLWTEPIALGVMAGLVIGKPIGIFCGAWLATRLTRATLAPGVTWSHVLGVSTLAGIGFTVSMLISDLAFTDQMLVDEAKTAVLVGSLVAACIGAILLTLGRRGRQSDHGAATTG